MEKEKRPKEEAKPPSVIGASAMTLSGSQRPSTGGDSSRLLPPPLSLPVRHKSFAIHDLEDEKGSKKITKEDYYEHIRKKPIKILMTREISRYYGRETYLKTTIREIIIYTIFLIILTALVLETPSNDIHLFTSSMAEIFTQTEFETHDGSSTKITYNEICTTSQIWIYFDRMVSTFQKYFFTTGSSDSVDGREDASDKSLHEDHLIGLPRMRIVRVRNDSCKVTSEFKDRFPVCFGHFSPENEDKRAFGRMHGSEWTFSSSEMTALHTVFGKVSTYSGGGFYKDFQKSAVPFSETLRNLRRRNWIDRATRAVIFDVTVYNVNFNLFCIIKLLFEIPPTGGVIPSVIIHTLKLIDYGSKQLLMLCCLVVFIVLFIFYTIEELYEMFYFKWQFIKSFWNILDVFIVLTCYLVIATNLFLYVMADATLSKESNDREFCNFDQILYVQVTCNWSLSLLVFFCWVKIFKYVNINQAMYQLQAALRLASKDIMWYSIIFMTVLFNFAFVGSLLFGFELDAFSSMWESVWTLLKAGVGDFDYPALQRMRPLLGPLFFFLLVFFMSYMLMAIYIAILLTSYWEVRSEIYTTRAQMKIGDVLQNWLVDFIATISNKMAARTRDALNKRKLHNKFQDVRFLLMKFGFSELEISMFLAKYEISEDRVMTEEDLQNVMKQFSEKGVPGIKMARDIVRQNVSDKLDAVEEALGIAQKKTTLVLNALQAIEMRRSRRSSR